MATIQEMVKAVRQKLSVDECLPTNSVNLLLDLCETYAGGGSAKPEYLIAGFEALLKLLKEPRKMKGPSDPTYPRAGAAEHIDARDKAEAYNRHRRLLFWIQNLHANEAQAYIELLNSQLPPLKGESRQTCLLLLQEFCVSSEQLPSDLPIKGLVVTNAQPLARGGYTEIYQANLGTQMVSLTRVRVVGSQYDVRLKKAFYHTPIVWKTLLHPNVVPFLGVLMPDAGSSSLCMVFKWMQNGDLGKFLLVHPSANRLNLLVDIACGLDFLHRECNTVHGGLKSSTILIDEGHRSCIADFCFSHIVHDVVDEVTQDLAGLGLTRDRWMAPELSLWRVGERPIQSFESDVYAFGMVMLEVFTGEVPFAELRLARTAVLKAFKGVRPSRPDAKSLGLSDDAWQLMEECWDQNPHDRPNSSELLSRLSDIKEERYLPLQDAVKHIRQDLLALERIPLEVKSIKYVVTSCQRSLKGNGNNLDPLRSVLADLLILLSNLNSNTTLHIQALIHAEKFLGILYCVEEAQPRINEQLHATAVLVDSARQKRRIDEEVRRAVSTIHLMPILKERKLHDSVTNLRNADAQACMDFMDSVLPALEGAYWKACRWLLQKLCGSSGLLPSSFVIKGLTDTTAEPVARGGYADIYQAKLSTQTVALKTIRVIGKQDDVVKVTKAFFREVVVWKPIRHRNVVPFLGVSRPHASSLRMVSKWMVNGNLQEYLVLHQSANRLKLLVESATGLNFLHTTHSVVHGDIKAVNILIDENHRACISDFGFSRVTHDIAGTITQNNAGLGTTRWMAPELFMPADGEQPLHTYESDVYAVGMVIFEAFTGKVPFAELRWDAMIYGQVTQGIRPARPESDTELLGLSGPVWRLAEDCWAQRRKDRPSISEVLTRLERALESWQHPERESVSVERKRERVSSTDSGFVQVGIPIGN